MDVSSKYFSHLRRPGPDSLKYVWRFLLDIRRVGKLRELLSFVLWEITHRLRFYRFGNQYVNFTNDASLSIAHDADFLDTDVIASSFLAQQGLYFQAITMDWKFCSETVDGIQWGCRFSDPNGLYCSADQSQSAVLVHEFGQPVTSLFISRQNALFVCSNGDIYRSDDAGKSFRMVLRLSTPISYFLFNNGMTELPDQTLIIGEYGSIWHGKTWQNLAFLYYSSDSGYTWETSDFLIRQGVNKHIHVVRYCDHLKAVLLTDGDNKKQVWINAGLSHFNRQADNHRNGWRLVNKYHYQTGGYLSMAETDGAVLFGSDYLGGTNFIVRTTDGRHFRKTVLPDPYRRSPIMNMITRQSISGREIWAVSYSCLTGDAKSLLMYTKDAGKTWLKVIEFDGANHEVRLVSSSHHPSGALYLSITEFGSQPDNHRHQVYKLECDPSGEGIPQQIPIQANNYAGYGPR